MAEKANEGLDDANLMNQGNVDTNDSVARQNILYIAAINAVKEIFQCKNMLDKSLKFLELKTEAITMCSWDASVSRLENQDAEANANILTEEQHLDMQPPKRVKSKGRPGYFVDMHLDKNRRWTTPLCSRKRTNPLLFCCWGKSVASLYSNENAQALLNTEHVLFWGVNTEHVLWEWFSNFIQ